MKVYSEAYSEPCQTPKIEVFAKIVSFLFLTIFAKSSILYVWQDPQFASEASNDLRKKSHLRCLTGYCIILAKLFPICLLSLMNMFHHVSNNTIVHGQIHVTLCLTYLLKGTTSDLRQFLAIEKPFILKMTKNAFFHFKSSFCSQGN